ncbi:hypothetical protein N7456_009846 [Penicillium angulare]|uniref:Uncharacterized protein n=1 Tax=Penicillium angulare TaxID=116970 RepID=A0A9W9F5M3_9EURO|nr:hypothetical protein N7456_009846 [Penicillium angulare]
MSLLSLSNEILLSIAQDLKSHGGLNSLVRTNRRLYFLLRHVLIRDDILYHDGFGILIAARRGYLSVVQQFVEAGCPLDLNPLRDGYVEDRHERFGNFDVFVSASEYPILYASADGHADVVEYLIAKGSKLDCKDSDFRTPLALALRNGHLSVVKVLLDGGVDIASARHGENKTRTSSQKSPIQEAAYHGHEDVIEYILSKSECPHDDAKSCISAAAASGNIDLVSLLLQYGVGIDFQKITGCVYGNMRPDEEIQHGPTALISAVESNQASMVQYLIENGADTECNLGFADDKQTALTLAVHEGNEDVVEILLDGGADFDYDLVRNAIKNREIGMLELLLTHLQIEYYDYQDTWLIDAARIGDVGIFRLLFNNLELGGSSNAEEALMEAIQHDKLRIVKFLLQKGTNPNVPSIRCMSALDNALSNHNKGVLELLLQYGAHIHPETLEYANRGDRRKPRADIVGDLARKFPVLNYSRNSMHLDGEFDFCWGVCDTTNCNHHEFMTA